MEGETLFVKNMVCDRCILVVKQEFEKFEIPLQTVVLGKVVTRQKITNVAKQELAVSLTKLGFEFLEDKKLQLVERIKNVIVELIHRKKTLPQTNFSDYLSEQLDTDYHTLSKLFSAIEHTTVEKFVIAQKIERVKELLSYNELTLSEISDLLHYSSVSHLSNQFKKVTGVTPSEYKNIQDYQDHGRFSLDNLS